MPVDPDRVVGAELAPTTFSWDDRQVILYNLAVGAGVPPTAPRELAYTYEGDLVALPTFGTIPPFSMMMMGIASVEGLDVDLAQILHGEHELVVHGDIPNEGSVTQTGRVTHLFDRGRGALLVVEVTSNLETSGEPLFTNRAGIYLRGEGGFGGDPGPGSGNRRPDRDPDRLVESSTLAQQALLYRQVSRDLNPLHADPGFAAFAGFPRPILHGLCTYGVVAKAVVDEALGGAVSGFGSFAARFSGHVFPGETLATSIWEEEGGCTIEVITTERGTPVLSNGQVRFLTSGSSRGGPGPTP